MLFYFQMAYFHGMTSRRDFIKTAIASSSLLYAPINLFGSENDIPTNKISVFSKSLHWLGADRLGQFAKEVGFDGVDLTVRPAGHVEPANVERDLPVMVKSIEASGLKVYSIVTAIDDADSAAAARILRTASSLGITHYRMNWINYDASITVSANLERMKKRFAALEKLNRQYNIHGAYQNHAGLSFGASVWDLYSVLKEFDPTYIGCQFDVRHAMVEGFSSWVNDFTVIAPFIKCYNVKDFKWSSADGIQKAESVALGAGVVDFKKFFSLVRQYNITGPVSLHFEYALGGAESGAVKINIPEEEVKSPMKKDLQLLRSFLNP